VAISKKLLNDGETVIISTREHVKVLIGPVLVLIVLLALAVAAQVVADNTVVTWVVWILAAIGIVWWTVRPFLDWATTVHAFTDRRLITRRGIITRIGEDIPLARINDVTIEIHLLDRLFGCGSLLITSASERAPVRLNDIPRVEQQQLRLNELLHDYHDEQRPGGPDGV
jgi:uncharacterized membrane protein YdbT with pleckstrin-like domain